MPTPEQQREALKYQHVSSSDRFVCTGESFGSYNYALKDEVFPPDQSHIQVDNGFGSFDYVPNPNYRRKRK